MDYGITVMEQLLECPVNPQPNSIVDTSPLLCTANP